MVTSRILTHRRRHQAHRPGTPQARPRPTEQPFQLGSSRLVRRIRLREHARIYLAGAAVLLLTAVYVLVSVQTTGTSYELARLQDQQQQLQADQDQLGYQQATLHTPARRQQEAVQQGMVRPMPAGYLAPQPLGFDTTAPLDQVRGERSMGDLLATVAAMVLRAGSPAAKAA